MATIELTWMRDGNSMISLRARSPEIQPEPEDYQLTQRELRHADNPIERLARIEAALLSVLSETHKLEFSRIGVDRTEALAAIHFRWPEGSVFAAAEERLRPGHW